MANASIPCPGVCRGDPSWRSEVSRACCRVCRGTGQYSPDPAPGTMPDVPPLIVVLDAPSLRVVYREGETEEGYVEATIVRWLHAAIANSRRTGVCRSFTVGAHVLGDCDHDVTVKA